ncbi:MAG: hypothetical protein MZU97_08210 [Bacillus subtilis]|nr:hypothetical protein [Bacillus subtilis]
MDIGAARGRGAMRPEIRRYRLYARLWSGRGQPRPDATTEGTHRRRPGPEAQEGRGVRGALRVDEDSPGRARRLGARAEFAVRDLPGPGAFNERIEALLRRARRRAVPRERLLEARARAAARREAGCPGDAHRPNSRRARGRVRATRERLRELGDILMANQGPGLRGPLPRVRGFLPRRRRSGIRIDPGSRRRGERPGLLRAVTARPAPGLAERRGRAGGHAEPGSLGAERGLAALEADGESLRHRPRLASGRDRAGEKPKRPYPGLSLERDGLDHPGGPRRATENDELLRRHVRGNDLWLHARDWPGSYVFIKAQRGQERAPRHAPRRGQPGASTTRRAGSNGGGELYYTFVKYLRRAKDGPKGLVIPTQEKNLSRQARRGTAQGPARAASARTGRTI